MQQDMFGDLNFEGSVAPITTIESKPVCDEACCEDESFVSSRSLNRFFSMLAGKYVIYNGKVVYFNGAGDTVSKGRYKDRSGNSFSIYVSNAMVENAPKFDTEEEAQLALDASTVH